MKKLDTIELLKRAKLIHGDKYDYSKTEYVNKRVNIIVTCKLHGDFTISPKNHWEGQGCKQCGYINRDNRRSETNKFIQQAKDVHGDKYDYTKTEYTTARNKVKIVCPIHGEFDIKAASHTTNKQGCRECGYMYSTLKKNDWIAKAKGRQGVFYIIKCYNDTEEFYKFGITSTTTKKRYSHKEHMPYKFEIIKEVVSNDLAYIWDLEKRFKRLKSKNRYVPLLKFNGSSTECFK
jgi:hypothetical protein